MIISQQTIIAELGVLADIMPRKEITKRVAELATYLMRSHSKTLVLGISGGIDSTVAGKIAQLAVQRARVFGVTAEFIAVRLPYGTQRDEEDAQAALEFIQPDQIRTVNIKGATDAMMASIVAEMDLKNDFTKDFVGGNIKARQRMIAQYAIAGATKGLVVGTDHAAEAVMGFFTKFGDGAADILPLSHLNKRQVRLLGETLGAPAKLVGKTPTADLEDLRPGLPDEVSYGVTYDQIDDFLEGKYVDDDARQKILKAYMATRHKRNPPVSLGGHEVQEHEF